MSLTSFSATMTRRCALGRVVLGCDVNGYDGMVVEAVGKFMEGMKNGDTLEVRVTRNLPADHPLFGIDLDAPEERS